MSNRIDKQSARYLKHCYDNGLFATIEMSAIMAQWITDGWVIVTVDDTFTETIMLTEFGRIVIELVDDANDTEPPAEDNKPRYVVEKGLAFWGKEWCVHDNSQVFAPVSLHDTKTEAQAEADRLNKTVEDDKPLSYRLVTETETEALRERVAALEGERDFWRTWADKPVIEVYSAGSYAIEAREGGNSEKFVVTYGSDPVTAFNHIKDAIAYCDNPPD